MPLEKAFLLKLIDECHQPAGVHPKPFGELLLAEPRGLRNQPQNPRIGRCELVRRKALSEQSSRVRTNLSQQEGRRTGASIVTIFAQWSYPFTGPVEIH